MIKWGRSSTWMCPLLILASVPTSKTGVFPERFLSCKGPKLGRSNPKREVSPSITLDTIRRKRSTSLIGSHFSNHIDSPKVDFPSISCGSTWTYFPISIHSHQQYQTQIFTTSSSTIITIQFFIFLFFFL